jgi:hypothetical protein
LTKRRRHPQRDRGARPPSEPQLPGNFHRALERWDRLLPTLRSNPDLRVELDGRRRRLLEILAPLDVVSLLGQVVLSEMLNTPDTYVESENPGAAYVVEVIAAALVARADRRGTDSVTPPIDANTVVPGWAHRGDDPYRLHRLRVLGGTTPQQLLALLAGVREDPPAPASYGST